MSNSTKCFARVVILVIASGLIVYGTARGEMEIVLNKAVNICLECIGLG